MLAVNQNSPFKTVQDVIDAARKSPGKLTSASAGNGSPHHLALEMFNQRAGVKIMNVPYKGAAPAIRDLLGGQVDIRSEEHTSELQSLMRNSYAVCCLKKKNSMTKQYT